MRIVIDIQGAQSTGSRHRGIGRYSLALAQNIARHRGTHEVFLVLNNHFSGSIEQMHRDFQDLLPVECIKIWHPTGPTAEATSKNEWDRKSSEILRENFIASLKPDMILITSLFEGLVDDAVTSINHIEHGIPTAVILYDLIPFILQKPYLDNPITKNWYTRKLNYLKQADLQLAISSSSRQESIDHLGTEVEHVVNISTAADPQFRPLNIQPEVEQALRNQYGLTRPYVMYTGGIDHRKNIEGLIRAYAALPSDIRRQHQLAVVCSIQPADRNRLEALAKQHALTTDELVLTGFVPEEDLLTLYNLCKVFIFPSWHEGFGLPALEAMACGRAVIGANCSSLPEVIGHSEALFDPRDDQAITEKLRKVLVDAQFRHILEQHALQQAATFSWEKSAKSALAAMERCHINKKTHLANQINRKTSSLPRLAYISPLPPERSGIADYSAELLPELAKYYDIDIIVAQEKLSSSWIDKNCDQYGVDWLLSNADKFDRVLYHFGNSSYHQHMFELLEKVPGIVVLHDFYLSGIVAHLECTGNKPGMWIDYLYTSHGYAAVLQRIFSKQTADTIWKYPCNLPILRNSQGIITHSQNSRELANYWYGRKASKDWKKIPLLRKSVETSSDLTQAARATLGFSPDQFIVCSFGLMGATKLNHRLLSAWLHSPLARDQRCILVFVGENDDGQYGASLSQAISDSGHERQIKITGWANTVLFQNYLHAADIGVQLRTLSRGETSAAVLDCMNYGLATIVNANGSMADLPDEGVWKLPDIFDEDQLVQALTTLHHDARRRLQLGAYAQQIIRTQHAPHTCAELYANAIEDFHGKSRTSMSALIKKIATISPPLDMDQLKQAAQAINRTMEIPLHQPQLLINVSALINKNNSDHAQEALLDSIRQWIENQPHGYRVEPIYACKDSESGYRYARQFTLALFNCPTHILTDEPIDHRNGDQFISLEMKLNDWKLENDKREII
ncbi:glycosyltransferase [Comamonas humi]